MTGPESAREADNEPIYGAIASLSSQLSGMTRVDAELAVARRTAFVSQMVAPGSLPSRIQRAQRIPCTIVSKTFSEDKKRYDIEFIALNNDKGSVEHIRSDRNDTAMGAIVDELWKDIRPGCLAVIYKFNDSPRNADRNVGPHGYRVAPYVELLAPAKRDANRDARR